MQQGQGLYLQNRQMLDVTCAFGLTKPGPIQF